MKEPRETAELVFDNCQEISRCQIGWRSRGRFVQSMKKSLDGEELSIGSVVPG